MGQHGMCMLDDNFTHATPVDPDVRDTKNSYSFPSFEDKTFLLKEVFVVIRRGEYVPEEFVLVVSMLKCTR
jgi:hypothetical protein